MRTAAAKRRRRGGYCAQFCACCISIPPPTHMHVRGRCKTNDGMACTVKKFQPHTQICQKEPTRDPSAFLILISCHGIIKGMTDNELKHVEWREGKGRSKKKPTKPTTLVMHCLCTSHVSSMFSLFGECWDLLRTTVRLCCSVLCASPVYRIANALGVHLLPVLFVDLDALLT